MINTENIKIKYINATGVGNSGKSALVDVLREIRGFYVPEFSFEFDLFRMPGGIIDLKHNIHNNWTPIKSDLAIKKFKKLITTIGLSPSYFDLIGMCKSSGQRYDARFNNKFIELSIEYINKFITGSYKALWPYETVDTNGIIRLTQRVLSRLGLKRYFMQDVYLVESENFNLETKKYIDSLFREVVKNDTDYVVFNNALEPTSKDCLDIIENLKNIVVVRDPRDIFVSGINSYKLQKQDKELIAFDNDGLNKSFLATDEIDTFVLRFDTYIKKLLKKSDKYLLIKFEDLVLEYEKTLSVVFDFLGIPQSYHTAKGRYFRPELSQNNIGLWKKYSNKKEINYIESSLRNYCYI